MRGKPKGHVPLSMLASTYLIILNMADIEINSSEQYAIRKTAIALHLAFHITASSTFKDPNFNCQPKLPELNSVARVGLSKQEGTG